MSEEESLQSLKDFKSEVQEILKCPVCHVIPRLLPIISCASGHIICNECRPSVYKCPLCRGSLFNRNFNSPIGAIVEIVKHKCKYHMFGCKYETNMMDIKEHEMICQERTIRCPFVSCHQEVQLRNFMEHALAKECAIDLGILSNI